MKTVNFRRIETNGSRVDQPFYLERTHKMRGQFVGLHLEGKTRSEKPHLLPRLILGSGDASAGCWLLMVDQVIAS